MELHCFSLLLLLLLVVAWEMGYHSAVGAGFQPNYGDALSKSILFFEGQRSGKLPSSQRMTWRKDSALQDGRDLGVDLAGGYYDAGDNLKFGFPMAYTTTLLSWSVIEFGNSMGGELNHAKEAVRWGTDYLLKATAVPNKVFAQVGEPYNDHNCWERPEDMDTARTSYAVDTQKPGSEIAAETAAALAAASIVFQSSDAAYSKTLLDRAYKVFDFADKYRGSYNSSIGEAVCPFYCDYNGYEDELTWGAAWIYKASKTKYYLDYATNNIAKMDPNGYLAGQFGWDSKQGGVYVLLYKDAGATNLNYIRQRAASFVCNVLPESPTKGAKYTPGGLLYFPSGATLQTSTSFALLLTILSTYLTETNQIIHCNGNQVSAPPSRLVEVARSQVDYILGNNPLQMSYMMGYGTKSPQRIHHRGSSLPPIAQHPAKIACKDGTPFYESKDPNPNVLVGAIVGGPNEKDAYTDTRDQSISLSEPTTYTNAAMAGALAYLTAH